MESSFKCFDLDSVIATIAAAGDVAARQVRASTELLESGNTIPFIARYRKEATGGLDESALRYIEDALGKARDLAERKETILKTIHKQGQLTTELRRQIERCEDKQTLENLYLPFKPKRKTRATVARDRGLQPLADLLLRQESLGRSRKSVLQEYVNVERDVPDEEAALRGACDIVAEHWSEDVEARSWLLNQAADYGYLVSNVKRGKKEAAAEVRDVLRSPRADQASPVASNPRDAARRRREVLARQSDAERRDRSAKTQVAVSAQSSL